MKESNRKKGQLWVEFRNFLTDSTFVEWTLGWATGEVVSRFIYSAVHDFLFPFLGGTFFGGVNIEQASFEVDGQIVNYGSLLVNAVDMLIVLFTVFLVCELIFFIRKKHRIVEEDDNAELVEIANKNTEILSEIRDALSKNSTSR